MCTSYFATTKKILRTLVEDWKTIKKLQKKFKEPTYVFIHCQSIAKYYVILQDELNVKFEELNKVKTFIKKQKESKGNVYLPNEYTEKHRLQNTIDNLKDKIQILVSTRNEQLWDFDNIPDGFQPMLELHHLKKDQVVYFVEKYLQRYTLGNKHKGQ